MFYFQSHTVVDSFYTIVIITCILTVQQDLSLFEKQCELLGKLLNTYSSHS